MVPRIEKCLGMLTPEQVWARGGENENAIGNLVLHLCGNMNQWIGTGLAGRPDTRQRDKEFAARGDVSPKELSDKLAATIADVTSIIRSFPQARLMEKTTIQNYNVTLVEVIVHVLEHFAQHTGQIIFGTKLLTGQDLGYYKHLNQPKHKETTP